MKHPHRLLMLASALVMLLAACSPQRTALPTPFPSLPPAQAPASTATAGPTSEPPGLGVPAIQYGYTDSKLVLASSLTGQPLKGFTPIPLGDTYSYAFTPDGHTLAVVYAATLYLVSLPGWKIRTVDIGLHGWMSALAFSHDGNRLALATGDSNSGLCIVDTRLGHVTASAQAGFAVHNLKFTGDGKALMVYGPHLAATGQEANIGVSIGAPEAALLSTSDLSPLWSARLDGLRDGTFPKQPNTPDLYQPGVAWHYSPGIAFAPGADVLYAVHGDADRLTTIDFTRRTVKTVAVRAKTSWFDRLLAWTAGVAYAKGMDGTTKQAVISPDGKLLYVVGSTEAVSKPEGSKDWNFTFTPIGLEVISVQDGSLVQKLDAQADMAALAPDKQHLLLLGWKQSSDTPWTEIYDIRSMQVTQHLDGVRLIPARRADGTAVLQSSVTISGNKCDMLSMDPESWSVIARWTATPCANWLMDP